MKLSLGVYILSILFIILGGSWVLSFLMHPVYITSGYFIWGLPYLVGGIGMLCRKYWALKISQIYLIISALPVVGIIVYFTLNPKEADVDLVAILTIIVLLVIFWVLPIWFLFKKSTVSQFNKKNSIIKTTKRGAD